MDNIEFRFACAEDANDIYDVYAPYVKETSFTFEHEIPNIKTLQDRISDTIKTYPYIVWFVNGHIAGYTYSSRHMVRAGYQWNAELSVYVKKEFCRLGIGTALYTAIIEILKLQNIHNVYVCVAKNNIASIKLHSKMGFDIVGTFHNAGYKLGEWHDILWMEKCIGNCNIPPEDFKGINEIEVNSIEDILERSIHLCKNKK